MKPIVFSSVLALLFNTPAFAACINPAGVEGEIRFNKDWKIMQFCDNENWIAMGVNPAAASQIQDGDKGDITVSGTGTVWTVKPGIAAQAAGNTGEIQFKGADGNLAADTALFWDNEAKELHIAAGADKERLFVAGRGTFREDIGGLGVRIARSIDATSPPRLGFERSRGTAENPAPVQDGDEIGSIDYQGYKDAGYSYGGASSAAIRARVDGAVTATSVPTALVFYTTAQTASANTERLRITHDGKVGIGTSTPAGKLDIAGDLEITGSDIGLIRFRNADMSDNASLGLMNGGLALSGKSAGTTPENAHLFITNAGDVGIGTTDPNTKLNIQSSGNAVLTIETTGTSNVAALRFGQNHGPGQRYPAFIGMKSSGANGDNQLNFAVASNMSATPASVDSNTRMVILGSNGNVGIGTATPSGQLQVEAGNNRGGYFLADPPSGRAVLSVLNTGYSGSGDSHTHFGYRGSDGLVINYLRGNRTNIDSDLQVSGTASKPGGGSWAATSDARLKTIDAPFKAGLKEIAALTPVRFHYRKNNPRNEPSERPFVGLIAQDVKPLIPEAVTLAPEGYYNLDITPIDFAVINAIKELKAENEALRATNNKLAAELKQIKAAIGLH